MRRGCASATIRVTNGKAGLTVWRWELKPCAGAGRPWSPPEARQTRRGRPAGVSGRPRKSLHTRGVPVEDSLLSRLACCLEAVDARAARSSLSGFIQVCPIPKSRNILACRANRRSRLVACARMAQACAVRPGSVRSSHRLDCGFSAGDASTDVRNTRMKIRAF